MRQEDIDQSMFKQSKILEDIELNRIRSVKDCMHGGARRKRRASQGS